MIWSKKGDFRTWEHDSEVVNDRPVVAVVEGHPEVVVAHPGIEYNRPDVIEDPLWVVGALCEF